jgi:hypothetical protein
VATLDVTVFTNPAGTFADATCNPASLGHAQAIASASLSGTSPDGKSLSCTYTAGTYSRVGFLNTTTLTGTCTLTEASGSYSAATREVRTAHHTYLDKLPPSIAEWAETFVATLTGGAQIPANQGNQPTTTTTTTAAGNTTTAGGTGATNTRSGSTGTTVASSASARPAGAGASTGSSAASRRLPSTGAGISWQLLVAGLCLGLGGAALIAGRPPRRCHGLDLPLRMYR